MADIRTRICWGRAAGVYIEKDRLTLTLVGSTPAGITILKQDDISVGDKRIGNALKQLLQKNLNQKELKNTFICLGLAPEHTFFVTFPGNFDQAEKISLEQILEASGSSKVFEQDQIAAAFIKLKKLKVVSSSLWSLSACQRSLAKELLTVVHELDIHNAVLQPGSWSLLSEKVNLPKQCRSWKAAVHLFLRPGNGLALLVFEGQVILWRSFSITKENSNTAVITALRSVILHAKASLTNPKISGIIIHQDEEDDIATLINNEMDFEAITIKSRQYSGKMCSYNLALRAKQNEPFDFDMFEPLRDPPTILAMFPWKRAAAVIVCAACMALFMWNKTAAMTGKYNMIKRDNASHTWAKSKTTGDISNEKKRLLLEVGSVEKFLSSRIIWTDYLRDIPTRVPSNACLSNFWAFSEMKAMSKKKEGKQIKKSLTLRGMTRFDKGQAAPEEIEAFLESLREVELLKRDFPQVQLAEIKWRLEGESEIATFTIVALPKKKGSDTEEES